MYMVFRGVFLIFCVLDKWKRVVLGDLTREIDVGDGFPRR